MPGIAFDQFCECLEKKGLKLSAAWGIAMPGNCQVLSSPAPDAVQKERFRNETEQTMEVARRISAREVCPVQRTNIVSRTIFSLFYSRLKPKERAWNFHTDETCTGCGTCARVYPAENISIAEKSRSGTIRVSSALPVCSDARYRQYSTETKRRRGAGTITRVFTSMNCPGIKKGPENLPFPPFAR